MKIHWKTRFNFIKTQKLFRKFQSSKVNFYNTLSFSHSLSINCGPCYLYLQFLEIEPTENNLIEYNMNIE